MLAVFHHPELVARLADRSVRLERPQAPDACHASPPLSGSHRASKPATSLNLETLA
jgi:hypothetical protein